MSPAPALRRVSASVLNSLDKCTMQYYLSRIEGIPEKVWPRTSAGTAVHGILEVLYRDKHRAHHDQIKASGTIYASRAITRLVRAWQRHLDMPDDIVADIDSMCMVAINHTNFLDEGAIRRFEPEHAFQFTLDNGTVVKGFIDKLAQFANGWVINDFKTARQKASKADVANSYQSKTYQLYLWKTFGALAEVRYHFLRHAPTKMTPQKHMMVTPPASPEELAGFEQYLMHMGTVINQFGIEEAHSGMCSDRFFCERVCSFFKPVRYWSISKTDGTHVRNVWIDPAAREGDLDIRPRIGYDEVLSEKSHPGCPRFN